MTAAGEPYCWGSNDSGQLGVSYATAETSPVPIAVGGNQDFTQISTSFFASCGLEHEGRTLCWGNPGTPAATGGDIRLRTLTTGTNYMCGTASTGAAYCWGFNAPGMGVRTGRADATPVVPPGPLPEILGAL